MHKKFRIPLLLALILPALCLPARGAMVRVAKRYNLIDVYGGASTAVGKYDGIAGFTDFRDEDGSLIDIDADLIYKPTFHLGFNYGQLRNNRMLATIGFRFTDVAQEDAGVLLFISSQGAAAEAKLRQFDLDFNFNVLLMNITEKSLSPYVGVGFRAGFTSATAKGFESESHLNTVLAGNFGAELKLWEHAKKRSFVTLASVNSYDLFSSSDRPKYLNIGGALKYYFRP